MVTFGSQLSVAVAVPRLNSEEHVMISEGHVSTGGVVSTILKVAELVEVFPQASLAVKVTTAEPVEPHRLLSEVKSFDQVTVPEQISEATAPPLEANHAFNAVVFPLPSHSTLWSEAWVVMVGGVVSTMVKVAELVEVFPQASLAVKVTTAKPVEPHRSLSEVKSFDQVIPEQLSEATAPPLEANHAFRSVVFPLPSHSTLWLEAWVVMVGAILSFTIIICVH
jgi:hypothetical protein